MTNSQFQINCKGKLLSLDIPIVMGIINATPDSFYEHSRQPSVDKALELAEKHLLAGASILDIGGYSSKPGAENVSVEEELNRVIPVISEIQKRFPKTIISVDTFRSQVAHKALEAGAAIINDISAGEMDEQMFDLVIAAKVPYIMMHMQGTPQTMQINPTYKDIVQEVTYYFSKKVAYLQSKGVADIILDLGFGFGKTIEHNYTLLNQMEHFHLFNLPILAGVSRKSMLYKPLEISANEALNATTVAHTIALLKGAKILRTHDVKEAVEAIKITQLTTKQL
jgi:dihydropteroate synthase